MATYYHGAQENIQADGAIQTLYLMNPSYVDYSTNSAATHQANNMQLFVNSPLNSLNSITQSQHHFVGMPLQPSQNTTQSQEYMTSIHNYSSMDHVNQSQLGLRRPNIVSVAQRGLSLSLSPQQGDEMKFAGQSILMGSKYLKVAQQLLDEVVNVETMIKKGINEPKKEVMGSNQEFGGKTVELSTPERQELQMKKAKLVNMLDEVEQRYKQYRHQMQIIVSTFESAAGFGSAKTYTSLALQTISKQFRCLRDAISNQIRAASKSLGEEDCFANGGGKSVGSRLRFVDHHLRQQRALQQLGMIQNNAWRPQRGLPERAVSVLRAWLFEHFLHPYPKDSDKHMLAKQTGLTRSQVSNWFINARVRLWKPMVEEMYLEETKDQEQNNEGENKSTKSDEDIDESTSQQENNTPPRTEHNGSFKSIQNIQSSQQVPEMFHESSSIMQQQTKKIRRDDSIQMLNMGIKQDEISNRELLMKFMDQGEGFGSYPIGEIARFDLEQFAPRFGSNGVSLTLGLPHGEPSYITNESIDPLESNSYFIGLNGNNSNNIPSSSNPNNGYESMSIQNRKRFAAQLLPDFVA